MTTMAIDRTDIHFDTRTTTRDLDLAALLPTLWHRFLAHLAERRLVAQLARLEPRRLRDMGFAPGDIYRAVEGSWDEVTTERFSRLEDN